MKLAAIDIIPIRAPRKETVRSGTGQLGINASEFGIVRLVTEDGLDGVGEISITTPRIGHTLCYAARTLIAPELLGMDPLAYPAILARIDALLASELSAPYLRAAFEMALLDLVGKHYGLPVYGLLGGKI